LNRRLLPRSASEDVGAREGAASAAVLVAQLDAARSSITSRAARVAMKRFALLCVLPLVLSTSTLAQNINDFQRTFGGVVQQALRQAPHSEWQRMPPAEFSCLDQNLRQQGASVDALTSRGALPADSRLAQLRSNCRGQLAQGPHS
jgi:hypothetical protein